MDKAEMFKKIEENRDFIISLGDRLFDCPELGFKEYKTAEIIKENLDALGISYESGIGETGVCAHIGEGDYHQK